MLISSFTNALLKSQVVFVFALNALWTNMNNEPLYFVLLINTLILKNLYLIVKCYH